MYKGLNETSTLNNLQLVIARCPGWCEEGYQIAIWNGTRFEYGEAPNDSFHEHVIAFLPLDSDGVPITEKAVETFHGERVDENTIFHYIEALDWDYDEDDNKVITKFQLSFTFYDCHYFVDVRVKDLDGSYGSICMEGNGTLFDSFEEWCTDEHWDFIQKKCREYIANSVTEK